ncbi:hypothetical protein [Mesorhizobium sp. DCY119]|uniref:hypothetical protein n=1 Tax=Mesorhizobium sp. DCY119 TaxID=2108445 RepID=UPI000E74647D|nr:hypothetical protein [Mesorhizobium sp. DCY119]
MTIDALREAERFLAYFAGETGGSFEGPGTPKTALAKVREALRTQPAEAGVTVKALEWDEHNCADVYGVKDCHGQGPKRYFLYRASTIIGWFDGIDAAKAAAQADYERRVRSALVPTPAPQGMDTAVEAAEAAVYPRHEKGFLVKPLLDAIDMRAALTAAYPHMTGAAQEAVEGEPVEWQREAGDFGWQRVSPDDLEHYRSKGARLRALYTTPQPAPSSADAGMLAALKEENERLTKERDAARQSLEHDRAVVITASNEFNDAFARRSWLLDSRGPYEWGDDRYRDEFRGAYDELAAPMSKLRKIGADWANCPVDHDEIMRSRQNWQERAEKSEAALAVASASPVQPEAEGWKTMDSAPKDGTRVLVYEIGRPVEVAHYNPKSWQWSNRYRPVRWRPLPAAPKQGGE